MNNVDSAVDTEVLVKFSLRILIIFAVIFVLAVLTPKLAKLVDSWIKKYRQNHQKQETYGIRSIYELPPGVEPDEEDYDLDADEEDSDEDSYPVDDEPVPEVSPVTIWIFSYGKIDDEPLVLNRKTVKFGRNFVPEPEMQDFSGIVFGKKNHPAVCEPMPEPDDEDEEFEAHLPPIRYAPFEERFFDDEPESEPAQETEEEDLPWFMR